MLHVADYTQQISIRGLSKEQEQRRLNRISFNRLTIGQYTVEQNQNNRDSTCAVNF